MGETQLMDNIVRMKIDQWQATRLAALADYLTPSAIESMVALGSSTILVLFSGFVLTVLIWRKKSMFALLYVIMLGGGALVTVLLKMSIQRARPDAIIYFNLFGITGDVISYSYPSGHVVKNTLFFTFLICLIYSTTRRKAIKVRLIALLSLVPVVIGLGQIISGRHYVSDVIGGYLVSFVWLGTSLLLLRLAELKLIQIRSQNKVKKVE